MDRPSKLNERLTLIANLSVVVGIIFLAVELNQNTEAIEGQTRDSITEKQMMFTDWIGPNREAAAIFQRGNDLGMTALDPVEQQMYIFLANGILREWENSHYQYRRGLFSPPEYQARVARWQHSMSQRGFLDYWVASREFFSPDFRAEIDAIVAEVGG